MTTPDNANPHLRVRREDSNEIFKLADVPLGRGGEATIHALLERPTEVAKIYLKPTPEHAAKLTEMIAAPPRDPMRDSGRVSIAWPICQLMNADPPGQFIGYLMPLVSNGRRIVEFYNPKLRKEICPQFHFGYLLQAARNLAAVMHALHERGYVIGDVNESNLLVDNQAMVAVVDTDSFQLSTATATFRCRVGKPEYTPPELQREVFADVDRAPEHDRFGLAVMIFQLLMQGIHPFMGVFTGRGEQTSIPQRISEGHYPYAVSRSVPYKPVPIAVPIQTLPLRVRELLLRCFDEGHTHPARRPRADEWVGVLDESSRDLTVCSASRLHLYPGQLSECPWCVQLRSGVDLFPTASGKRPEPGTRPADLRPPTAPSAIVTVPESHLPAEPATTGPSTPRVRANFRRGLISGVTVGGLLLALGLFQARPRRPVGDRATQKVEDIALQTQPQGSTNQVLVPLGSNEVDPPFSEWADAGRFAVLQDDVCVRVDEIHARVNQLQIQLVVENLSATRTVYFMRWSGATGAEAPLLLNHAGSTVAFTPFGEAASKPILPGRKVTDLLVFNEAIESVRYLRLELPASAFQGNGKLRLHLARTLILLKAAPSLGGKALPLLAELLEDNDAHVRLQAVRALGEPAVRSPDVIPSLVRAINDKDSAIQSAALTALGNMGPEARSAIPALFSALENHADALPTEIADTIEKLGPLTRDHVLTVGKATKSSNGAARLFAVRALATIGSEDPGAHPYLTSALKDADEKVRLAAVTALAPLNNLDADSVEALASTLEDTSPAVRQKTLMALAKMTSNDAVVSILVKALRSKRRDVSAGAITGLQNSPAWRKAHIPALMDAMNHGSSEVRTFAVIALGAVGSDAQGAVPDLLNFLNNDDLALRKKVIQTLGQIGPKAWRAIRDLGKALSDDDEEICKLILISLEKIGPDAKWVVPQIVHTLKKPGLRDDAIRVLRKLGKEGVKPLLEIAQESKDFTERRECIDILGAMGPEAKEAVPALTSMANSDRYPGLREAAKRAIGKIERR